MTAKQIVMLVLAVSALASCKKDQGPKQPTTDTTKVVVKAKDTVYLLNKAVTKQLLTPSPVTQTDSFTYSASLKLVKHTMVYKSNSQNQSTTYSISYTDGRVGEVRRSGGSVYNWDKLLFTYNGTSSIKVVFVYPDKKDSVLITLNSKGLPKKLQGNGQFYLFTYDDAGNISNRSQYDDRNPTKAAFSNDFAYDKKHSPFLATRNNDYVFYILFNDIDAHINNRTSDNKLEIYSYEYNKAGYPTKMTVVHGPVAVRTVEYSYTTIIKNK